MSYGYICVGTQLLRLVHPEGNLYIHEAETFSSPFIVITYSTRLGLGKLQHRKNDVSSFRKIKFHDNIAKQQKKNEKIEK
jgi:hypothetical protein